MIARRGAIAVLLVGGLTSQIVAQSAEPPDAGRLLSRAASFEVRDVSLEVALSLLARRSGVQLAFSSDDLGGKQAGGCSCANVTVGDALDSVLAGTDLKYQESRGRVIVGPGVGGLFRVRATPPEPQVGTVAGLVISRDDGTPVRAAAAQIRGRLGEVRTDAEGRFLLSLRAGVYDISVRALGFSPETIEDLEVVNGAVDSVTVVLERAALRLRDIIVAPSAYGILKPEVIATRQSLTRDEINNRPHFADDLYRSLYRLPGVVTHDVSARLQVRGSNNNEVLQTLDGLELYEPLHLKDIGGAMSIIDVESVAELDLSTGGFTAEYGDRLAGVFAMRSATPPPDRTTTTLGASFTTFTAKSQGGFAGGKGTWLVSARRGFLDVVLKLLGETEDVRPTYYDFFTKAEYQVDPRHLISVHALHAGDSFFMHEDDATEVNSGWGSSYIWGNWQADFSSKLSGQTVLSAGRITRNRIGQDVFDWDSTLQRLEVEDRAALDVVGLKQDWSMLFSEQLLLRWGFDAKHAAADYDYSRWRLDWIPNFTNPFAPPWSPSYDTLTVDVSPTGNELAAYFSARIRPRESLTAELGLRYDFQSHTGDETLSPRVNVAVDIAAATTLRAAWGFFYQSHDLSDLDVMNGVTEFYSAQRAEHRILGVTRLIGPGTSLRIEAYDRRISNPWPEYWDLEPALTDVVQEEYPEDIVRVEPARGRARGIEFLVKHNTGGPFAWAATYTFAEAKDEIDGAWIARARDQRHAVFLEFAFRPNPSWSLSGGWHYHSAWPGTERNFQIRTLANGDRFSDGYFGPMHALRMAAYHRLDLRVSRYFLVGRGRLTIFLDVFNLYGRPNSEAYEFYSVTRPDGFYVYRHYDDMIGTLPNIGLRWEF